MNFFVWAQITIPASIFGEILYYDLAVCNSLIIYFFHFIYPCFLEPRILRNANLFIVLAKNLIEIRNKKDSFSFLISVCVFVFFF